MTPEGFYAAHADAVDTGETGTGTGFVEVLFRIKEGEEKGSLVSWRGYLSEKTVARTAESLAHMGFRGRELTELTLSSIPSEVQIVVEHHSYQGNTSARVKWVNAPSGKKSKPVDFGKAMKDALKKATAADDIPF